MQPENRIAPGVARGPRFFEAGGDIMFENVLDARSKIGPRVATEDDLKTHRDAYERMGEELQGVGPRVVIAEEHAAAPVERPYAARRAKAAG